MKLTTVKVFPTKTLCLRNILVEVLIPQSGDATKPVTFHLGSEGKKASQHGHRDPRATVRILANRM